MVQYVNEFFLSCRASIDRILLSTESGSSLSALKYAFYNLGLTFSKFFQRQKVNVRLNADTWVVGIIVGFVHLASLVNHPTTERSKLG